PVKDLKRSITFFTSLGYTFNPQFTNDNATCMIISEDIYAMLLIEPFFQSFSRKEICDTSKSIESIICLSAQSRKKGDEVVKGAREAGPFPPTPPQDQGFMYGRSYRDLDGHLWEV